jgi:1,4-dihydroxy-2-naphthoate octaprenyltransferase
MPSPSPAARATLGQWVEGARPRTLPAAISPVLAGTAVALDEKSAVWWKALLALAVALLLQVGVNYANDYSDGIRGTDAARVGPLRLVGSGLARPGAVKAAAFLCLGLAAVVGLVLAATTAWWLVAVGLLAILAAWFYTGGSRPYGYLGLGEVMVFVFFGLVAVMGTTYVQTESFGLASGLAAIGIGCYACAILVANNLRDIPTDRVAGKRTLAVVLGDRRTRHLYGVLVDVALLAGVGVAATTTWWALLALIAAMAPTTRAVTLVLGEDKATGPALVPVLKDTGLAELLYGAGMLVGVAVSLAANLS